jgi:Lrp/AsnC family leucine-responsive transcriptional regulator
LVVGKDPQTEVDIMKKLDKIDRIIISMLQKNARASLKEIAKEVFLSSPSVAARIERLEREGVITGYHAQINPMVLNYRIKAFICLELDPTDKPVFYPFIKSVPNVVECNCVTGDYSMLIEVYFESTPQLDHFINELQQFGRTKTLIVFSTSVEQRAVPLRAEEDDERISEFAPLSQDGKDSSPSAIHQRATRAGASPIAG